MRNLIVSLLFLILILPNLAFSEETYPFVGRVNGTNVNVRIGTGANSVVIKQLDRGSLVFVLAEEEGWYAIEPPKGTSFWIYSRLLKNGWPKSDDINVRSGPGTHYPIVCQVGKTTSLDILDTKGDWTRIAPPLGSKAMIVKDYVSYFSTPDKYALKLEEEKRSKELFQQAEDFRDEELNQATGQINFDLVLEKYQSIIDRYPGSPIEEKVMARIKDTQAKKEVALRHIEAMEMKKKRAAVRIPDRTEPAASPKRPSREIKVVKNKPKKEVVLLSFEGLLRPVKNSRTDVFTHQLKGGFLNTRRLCLLSAPEINLSSYHGKKVRVWGKFVEADSDGLSGIRVERIELAR